MEKEQLIEITSTMADILRREHPRTTHIKWEENDGRQRIELKDITYIPRKRKFQLYLLVDNNLDFAELSIFHNARPDFYINTDTEVDKEKIKKIAKCIDDEINWVKLNPQKRK